MIIYVEKNNTNCRELPINYSKIINDYSCIFMIIHVEKKKTRIAVNYPWITQKILMIIRVYFWLFMLKKRKHEYTWIHTNTKK